MKNIGTPVFALLLMVTGCVTTYGWSPDQESTVARHATTPKTHPAEEQAVIPAEPAQETTPAQKDSFKKPKMKDIQTALKNAEYYTHDIDGKFGPKTKKALEEFQAANGLNVDGTVGPQTWTDLKKYLNLSTETQN